jgi:hypothetical protein
MLAGQTVVQAALSSFMHEQRKVPKERCLKSVDSRSSHNSANFKVSHYLEARSVPVRLVTFRLLQQTSELISQTLWVPIALTKFYRD